MDFGEIIDAHREHVPAGSIEEKSIETALQFIMGQNPDMGEQIIRNLALPEKTKDSLVRMAYEIKTGTGKPLHEDIEATLRGVVNQDKKDTQNDPQVAEINKGTENTIDDFVPPPPQTSGANIQSSETTEEVGAQTHIEDLVVPEPVQAPKKISVTSSSEVESSVPEPSLINTQDLVVPQNNPTAKTLVNTHLEQKEAARKILEEVIGGNTQEIGENAYKEVFANAAPNIPVPPIIKTYDEPTEPDQAHKITEQRKLEASISKTRKMFDAVEAYLIKATKSGEPSIMKSAKRQLESLKNRYPEYVSHRPDHIKKLDELANTPLPEPETYRDPVGTEKQLDDSLDINEQKLVIGNLTVKPGMAITGNHHRYTLSAIDNEGPTGVEVQFKDELGQYYVVTSEKLAWALSEENLEADTFFSPYRVS